MLQEGTGAQEDKLSLACFNSGDVPELIGRLNVALSPANHKVISLPMFRRDLGVSLSTHCLFPIYYSVMIW